MATPASGDKAEAVGRLGGQTATTRHPGSTLLPGPVASLVSLATKVSAVSLQVGTFIARQTINGARVGSLTGLELARAAFEVVFLTAGRDVAGRSLGRLGLAEAESVLESNMATLHSALTQASFIVAVGFHFSSTALLSASAVAQHTLSLLDSVLGSNESSRAVASIVTLARREFRNPKTGIEGERVGVLDLLFGVIGFALLQQWARKRIERQNKEAGVEEVVWDVVILSNGMRADVVTTGDRSEKLLLQDTNPESARRHSRRLSISSVMSFAESIKSVQALGESPTDGDILVADVRNHIARQLPPHADVSVLAGTSTTVIVEISGTTSPDIQHPPGLELVGVTTINDGETSDTDDFLSMAAVRYLTTVRYRLLYREAQGRVQTTFDQGRGGLPNLIELDSRQSSWSSGHRGITSTLDGPSAAPHCSRALEPVGPVGPAQSRPDMVGDCKVVQRDPTEAASGLTDHTAVMDQRRRNLANQKRPRDMTPAKPSSELPKSKLPRTKGSLAKLVPGSWSTASVQSKMRTPWRLPSGVVTENVSPSSKKKKEGSVRKPSLKKEGSPSTTSPTIGNRSDPRLQQASTWANTTTDNVSSLSKVRSKTGPSSTATSPIPVALQDGARTVTTGIQRYPSNSSNQVRPDQYKEIGPEEGCLSVTKRHRRSDSVAASIYTLGSNTSQTSLVLAGQDRETPCGGAAIQALSHSGMARSSFPHAHLVKNLMRFVRFASASYGSHFLRVMGLSKGSLKNTDENAAQHHEHVSFSNHTRLPSSTILLSSFVDPQGGSDAAGETETGLPLVHFVSVDHESKAVVLTCRGTLGFEDVLTDMACEFDNLHWRGKTYKVHKGMHASARRLLSGRGGRMMITVQKALEEYHDYGLVLCGHSLGGGVSALLAIMISEPGLGAGSSAFVTSSEPWRQTAQSESEAFRLPPGRPIHAFAYGPPATVSAPLRLATQGLVTTVINGQDIVPYLSLGTLHDMQAVALAFKTDRSGAKGEVHSRIWETIRGSLSSHLQDPWTGRTNEEEDEWAYSALKSLRASMVAPKLVPPGDIFVVQTQAVLLRDAFTGGDHSPSDDYPRLGKPATRAVLKYVRDVQARFSELRFGARILGDHSPGRYEASLAALSKGVLDEA